MDLKGTINIISQHDNVPGILQTIWGEYKNFTYKQGLNKISHTGGRLLYSGDQKYTFHHTSDSHAHGHLMVALQPLHTTKTLYLGDSSRMSLFNLAITSASQLPSPDLPSLLPHMQCNDIHLHSEISEIEGRHYVKSVTGDQTFCIEDYASYL